MIESKSNRGNSAAVFELKQKVVGNTKAKTAVAIKNPENNQLVTEPNQILKVSLQYCKALLTSRPSTKEYESDIEVKHLLHEKRMAKIVNDDIDEMSDEMFSKS